MSHYDDTCLLEISRVLPSHEGEYSCVATNLAGMVTCAATLNIDGEFSRRSHTNWIKLTGSYCTFISCQEGPKSVHVPHRTDFNFRISCGFPVRQGLTCIMSDSQSVTALTDYGDIMMAACKHVLISQVCFKSPSIPPEPRERLHKKLLT